jgi:predicted helicase
MSVVTFLAEVERHLKSDVATEHSYRPALQKLFDTVFSPARATNEPKHAVYGAPDFVIQQGNTPIGHVEAKDVGVDLAKIVIDSEKDKPLIDNGQQLRRYRAALPNLLYTDGLVWYWFVGGEARLSEPLRIATWDKARKRLNVSSTAADDLTKLLTQFASQKSTTVNTPIDLARRLAQVARWLHDVIVEVFKSQDEHGDLHQQLEAFRKTLLPTLTPNEFADMYAQTIVYGLFAARVAGPTKPTFTRMDAAGAIPRTNPFLRKLFHEVAGYDLDERIAWLVDDCAYLLERTDMASVLRDFGKATRQEDPVVHFYETFLAAYDPRLREVRGVYYTPEPVVSYIVRSVDALLRSRFNKPMGLADDKTIVLDPATGTATFLYAVVQQIYATLAEQGLAGTWNSYVAQKLLPRVFGFELLMAPYTVAHLKMGLLLDQLGYKFGSNERLGIYLTNTLADVPDLAQQMPFAQYIAEEGRAANKVKHDKPVMVVLGNPPYSNFGRMNNGDWILSLMKDWKPEGERKWNPDDFMKFMRWGQWRIEKTGAGILAFITNNTYIDGITHGRMRKSLMDTFTEIYILDLHGNAMKKEKSSDGAKDDNVFDIRPGVCIGIFIKDIQRKYPTKVHVSDLWGARDYKYEQLMLNDVGTTPWKPIDPSSDKYFFKVTSEHASKDFFDYRPLGQIIQQSISGVQTKKDDLFVGFTSQEVESRLSAFLDPKVRTQNTDLQTILGDSARWIVDKASRVNFSRNLVRAYMVSPFDFRFVYYEPKLLGRARYTVMRHMLNDNVGLVFMRQSTSLETYDHFLATDSLITDRVFYSVHGAPFLFPLYLYPDPDQPDLFDTSGTGRSDRRPNLSPTFIVDVEQRLGLRFVPDGRGDLQETIGPEDVFHYAYAVFHSPTYRSRYVEFLKIDFPRLPITSDRELFAALAAKGAEFVDLHLLRLPGDDGVGGNGGTTILVSPGKQGVTFPKAGSGAVDKIAYVAPHGSQPGRVVINNDQYFEGIEPETWEMHIGGYQPLDKWLKDRKGRTLTVDDVQHYLRMVIALRETRRIMDEIDVLIPGWPLT